jgi:predicted Fe-S protein YdhL (DUF1289 family)
LEFEINMLTCNRCRRKCNTQQVHYVPHGFMNKWIDLYDKKREEVLEARRQFKRSNPRNTPLPSDLLGEWGKDCTLEWVTEQIQNQIEDACIDSNITEDEINMCRGCERKVQLEFYKMLFPYSFDTINYFNIRHYICFH